MRAQVSLEYLIVLAIATLLVVPIFYLLYTHSVGASEQVVVTRIDTFGSEALKQAKTMYYTGRYAKTTIAFDMPTNIQNITAHNYSDASEVFSEIVVDIQVGADSHSLVYFTDIPVVMGNCTDRYELDPSFYSPGKKRIVVESCGRYVSFYVP